MSGRESRPQERRPAVARPAGDAVATGAAGVVQRTHPASRAWVPASGGPNFLRAMQQGSPRWTAVQVRRLSAMVLLLWWGLIFISGRGETVVLVAPFEIRGSLGRNGDTPVSAARKAVAAIEYQNAVLRNPAFEMRIGATSLDRSLPAIEQMRWLPTAPELRLRAVPAWWYAPTTSPAESVILPQQLLIQGVWVLAGRKTRVLTGEILAAAGRLTVQSDIDGHPLHYEGVEGSNWTFALSPISEALLLKEAPIASVALYVRSHQYYAVEVAVEDLLADGDPGNDTYALGMRNFAQQVARGAMNVPWRGYAKTFPDDEETATPRWWSRLIDSWPSRARRRRQQAAIALLAASQAAESGAFSIAEQFALQARRCVPRDRGAALMLAYVEMRQDRLREAYDLANPLAVRWPEGQPNHGALLLSEILHRMQYPEEAIRGAESLAFPTAPGDPLLHNNRGVWAWYRGNYESAQINLDAALEQRPRRAVAVENRALITARQDDLMASGMWFRRARTRTETVPSAWLHPARLLFDIGNYVACAELLEEGLTVIPEAYELGLQAAYARAAAGQADVAVAAIESWHRAEVPVARYQLYRGHIAYLSGDLQTAEEAYREAENAGEASGIAAYGLGQVFLQQGNDNWAAKQFETFLLHDAAHGRARLFCALSMRHQRPQLAETLLRDAVRAEPRIWIRAMMELYLGERTPESVRLAAYEEAGITTTERMRRRCTVEFHIGSYLLMQGGRTPAAVAQGRQALQASLETGLAHHYEYQMAAAWLRQSAGGSQGGSGRP